MQKFDDQKSLGGIASQQVSRILALKAGLDLKKGDILKATKDKFFPHIDELGEALRTSLVTLTKEMGVKDDSFIPSKDAISLIAAVFSKEEWEKQKDIVIAYLWTICLTVDWDSATNLKAKQ